MRAHVNSKGIIPSARFSEEVRTCDAVSHRDSEPSTLAIELFQPVHLNSMFALCAELSEACEAADEV